MLRGLHKVQFRQQDSAGASASRKSVKPKDTFWRWDDKSTQKLELGEESTEGHRSSLRWSKRDNSLDDKATALLLSKLKDVPEA